MKKENNTNVKKATKKRFNMHDCILKSTTVIAVLGFIVSACAIDSKSLIFAIVCFICELWIILFISANKEKLNKMEK